MNHLSSLRTEINRDFVSSGERTQIRNKSSNTKKILNGLPKKVVVLYCILNYKIYVREPDTVPNQSQYQSVNQKVRKNDANFSENWGTIPHF